MTTRAVGLTAGIAIGVAVALLPVADWWELSNGFTPIPGGVAAAVGAVVAGYVLGPRVASRRQSLGLVAIWFAVVMYLASVPLVALDAALMSAQPLDEDWPVTFGPVVGDLLGTLVRTPLLLAVASVSAGLWTALVSLWLTVQARPGTPGDISRR